MGIINTYGAEDHNVIMPNNTPPKEIFEIINSQKSIKITNHQDMCYFTQGRGGSSSCW